MEENFIMEQIYNILCKHNFITVKNISSVDSDIDVTDCYLYLLEKIDLNKYVDKECDISLLKVEVRRKLINYFNKITNDKYLELKFNKHHRYVNEKLDKLDPMEKSILLHFIDKKYKKFLDLSFLNGTNHRYKKKYINSIKNKYNIENIKEWFENSYNLSGYDDFSYTCGEYDDEIYIKNNKESE